MNENDDRLISVGSEKRGPVLLELVAAADDAEARRLLDEWWTSVDAWGHLLGAALASLTRVGLIEQSPLPRTPDGIHRVFRATGGEEPTIGSWTLDETVAENFARMIAGPRGHFLGIHAEAPFVWEGFVHHKDILGYFTDRNESEVVVGGPGAVGVQPIKKLVRAEP